MQCERARAIGRGEGRGIDPDVTILQVSARICNEIWPSCGEKRSHTNVIVRTCGRSALVSGMTRFSSVSPRHALVKCHDDTTRFSLAGIVLTWGGSAVGFTPLFSTESNDRLVEVSNEVGSEAGSEVPSFICTSGCTCSRQAACTLARPACWRF